MYVVYLLQSLQKSSKTYVGLTLKPPEKRLREHNSGMSKYGKLFLPWKLVYYEQFYCRLCAEKRERFLKSGKGFRLRKLLVTHQSMLE